jgi:predicted RNA binding protein YcfA (HicA-like mRNA interferase family)
MPVSTNEILEILHAHGITPDEPPKDAEISIPYEPEFPEIGEIGEGETVYTTSLDNVLGDDDPGDNGILTRDDPRIREWWRQIHQIMQDEQARKAHQVARTLKGQTAEPPEPHCAWYCPIHFFGHGWGIYIREQCVLAFAVEIASFVDWGKVDKAKTPPSSIAQQLLRSAFYAMFLHEQFHHKVESLGFRLLVATGTDRYRPYKAKVYRPAHMTSACFEEGLANADSYRRLGEPRYKQRVDSPIRAGLRAFLRWSIPRQPPGYKEGDKYRESGLYRDILQTLQSQILEGVLAPKTPATHWSIAPKMITALMDIEHEIYVILPKGAEPLFKRTFIDPGFTTSTKELVRALTRYYGYTHVRGGKGSHVKLERHGAKRPIVLPGNRRNLSPGTIADALDALGGYKLRDLHQMLKGELQTAATG